MIDYIEKPKELKIIEAIRWDGSLQTVRIIASKYNIVINEKEYKDINFSIESKGTRINFRYSSQWYGLIATVTIGYSKSISTSEYICFENERIFILNQDEFEASYKLLEC